MRRKPFHWRPTLVPPGLLSQHCSYTHIVLRLPSSLFDARYTAPVAGHPKFGLAAHSYVALEHAKEIIHRAMNTQIRPEAVEIELYLSVQLLARDGFGKKMA